MTKTCTRCGLTKPTIEFAISKHHRLGVAPKCKVCMAEYARQYRQENRAKVKATKAAYRQANIEREREKDRLYHAANAEARREYQRQYRATQSVKKLETNRRWREANPEKWNNYRHERRARQRSTQVGPIDFEALWTGLCALCGSELDPALKRPDQMSKSVDHIVPLARGGTHTQDNLQWVHLRCNFVKGAKVPTRRPEDA